MDPSDPYGHLPWYKDWNSPQWKERRAKARAKKARAKRIATLKRDERRIDWSAVSDHHKWLSAQRTIKIEPVPDPPKGFEMIVRPESLGPPERYPIAMAEDDYRIWDEEDTMSQDIWLYVYLDMMP
jgi:hypothetical protein